MSRWRFTVRRMMVAVALVAVVLGVFLQWRRAAYCMHRAALHAKWEAKRRADGRMLASHSLLIIANISDADADEHARLSSMYQHVAFKPWEPLPVDPFLDETPIEGFFDPNSP